MTISADRMVETTVGARWMNKPVALFVTNIGCIKLVLRKCQCWKPCDPARRSRWDISLLISETRRWSASSNFLDSRSKKHSQCTKFARAVLMEEYRLFLSSSLYSLLHMTDHTHPIPMLNILHLLYLHSWFHDSLFAEHLLHLAAKWLDGDEQCSSINVAAELLGTQE